MSEQNNGQKITVSNGELSVPDHPIIPFIEGDGTGPDIWAAAVRVIDAAVEKGYSGNKKIVWKEVFAGEQAFNKSGSWLPDETLETINEYLIAIKGPLTTPVGGGIRSLNVALRQNWICTPVFVRCAGLKGFHRRLRNRRKLTWSFSAKIRKIFTPGSNGWMGRMKLKK